MTAHALSTGKYSPFPGASRYHAAVQIATLGSYIAMAKAKDVRLDRIHASITNSVSRATFDRDKRLKALKRLEAADTTGKRKVALYYSRRDRSLSHQDVLPFVNMLKSMVPITDLDLVVISPGGDGTAAETMLDLCRKYCGGKLRIVVPLYGKSAATLLALGADEIVMGETSELGPIDAQVMIVQDNEDQQVSADHFLRARDDAIKNLASTETHVREAAQIQLTLLSPAFLQSCQDLMNFSQDFAGNQLRAHMFREEFKADKASWDTKIEAIVDNLTSSKNRLLHGRMITADDIQQDQILKCLKLINLANDDPYWIALNELLLRTETIVAANDLGKVLFATKFQMFGG
jgi:ATP-dependent protease ClpP protease subunit